MASVNGATGTITGLATTAGTLAQFGATTSAQLAGVLSDETGTGPVVFSNSPTLVTPALGVATGTSFNSITALSSTTPVVNGVAAIGVGTTTARGDHVHPTDTSRAALASPTFTGTVTIPASASISLPKIDNPLVGYTTTASSATPIVLTVTSNQQQYITGSAAQTVTMPVVSTLTQLGQYWEIVNNSTLATTVNSSGANLIVSIPANSYAYVTCILLTGTTAASWNAQTRVTLTAAQTLTNKTLTAPVISSIVNTGTLTLPTSTDTLVGLATTDTLVNKTLTTPIVNNPKVASTYTAKTTAYTFASGDEGGMFSMNNAATQQFNIPVDATFNFAIGTEINVFWITGAGQPTVGATTPGTTTVISTGATSATPKLRVANSGATCKKLAANSWIVFGDLA